VPSTSARGLCGNRARRLHFCILPGEPLAFNQFLFKSLAFDPAAFEPVTQLFTIVQALVAGKSLNVNTLSDLLALSKAKPGTLSYSTGAVPFGVCSSTASSESVAPTSSRCRSVAAARR
jgi:tripartite-type tricarboxylate transporter receptor subunit TctC